MTNETGDVSISMIDSTDGRSLQSWSFIGSDVDRITIGRDESASVKLADPYVSRIHLEIVRDADGWKLHALGRNGVYVDGCSVTEYRMSHGLKFRLASVGPTFRFDNEEASIGRQTLVVDPTIMQLLNLNKDTVVSQADEIAQTEYFLQLQQKAREFRKQRSGI
jgi:pSer/pThr/pTyr-binding forkhead associated (FHA) protein